MPNHLEYIVRPAQAPSIRPGVATQTLAAPKVIVNEGKTWGGSGDSIFDLTASDQVELPKAKWEESDRTYDVVRVFNKDDRSVYIDTEQMTQYSGFNNSQKSQSGIDPSRTGISKDRIILRFAAAQNTDDTEVISRGNKRVNTSGD